MAKIVSRLFAISPGEEKKTSLLYVLHFVFFLGQSWGSLACLTLFLDNWPAEDLSFMFIGSAVIMFAVGLAYSSFADRISDFRLLLFIVSLTALWLLSVRVLLVTNGGPYGLVYPYFYLVYDLVRDVSVLHLITYTNGFYNTRSAKQAMPVVLSGGLAGNMVAGFTVALLGRWIGLENIPLVWLGMLVVATSIIFVVQHRFGSRASEEKIDQTIAKTQTKQRAPSGLRSLQEGYAYVRSSELLRWLALAAFGMMLLMNVLMYQSSEIFQIRYAGNPESLLRFYGLFTGISSLVGVFIQAFLINRMITAIGVGASSMIFPVVTGMAVTLLGAFPTFLTAIFGSVTQLTLRRAVQTPIDAIIYNCLPPEIKGRSRAFILGLVIPLGALTGGLLLLGVRQGLLTASALSTAGILIAGVYIFAMLRVRQAYSLAFARLLADGEMAFLASGQDAFARPDPSVISSLATRLYAAESADMTVFLAEMLYELQGQACFQELHKVFRSGDAAVQAELITFLGREWIAHPTVSAMCLEGLQSDDRQVKIAAVQALAAQPDIHANRAVMQTFRVLAAKHDSVAHTNMQDDEIVATLLPTLLTSSEPDDMRLAHESMADWLGPEADQTQRMLAMQVLSQAGDDALLDRLTPFINDPASAVRLEALRLISGLIAEADETSVRNDALTLLVSFLNDSDDFVRLAAVEAVGALNDVATAAPLWPLLTDSNFYIRRQACLSFPPAMRNELQDAAGGDDPILAESAAYILVDRLEQARWASSINEYVVSLINDMDTLQVHANAASHYDRPVGHLLSQAISDQIEAYEERVFWLIGALCGHTEAGSIRRLLTSGNEETRANAAEALESVTSPTASRDLVRLCTSDPSGHAQTSARRIVGGVNAEAVIRSIWPEYENGAQRPELSSNLAEFYATDWLKAIAIHLVVDLQLAAAGAADEAEIGPEADSSSAAHAAGKARRRKRSPLDLLLHETSPSQQMSLSDANSEENGAAEAVKVEAQAAIDKALAATAQDKRPIVGETVAWVQAMRTREADKETKKTMLTVIEKVLFLKEAPFFADMSIDQLRILAAISEEVDYGSDETIAAKGEAVDTLYVVVQGKVAVQSTETTPRGQTSVRRLSTLGPRDYFGEMSVFDNQPFGSSVVTILPTKLLSVRQAPLLALIGLHPDLGLSLLRVFSLRLRNFMALAEERTAGRPKQLMDLYDKFE